MRTLPTPLVRAELRLRIWIRKNVRCENCTSFEMSKGEMFGLCGIAEEIVLPSESCGMFDGFVGLQTERRELEALLQNEKDLNEEWQKLFPSTKLRRTSSHGR